MKTEEYGKLYPNSETLDGNLFANPTKEYRGAPFWAWNCAMTRENISRCVDTLQEMGMGGGHLHVRTGMSTPYLSPEFMDLVRFAKDKLQEKDMLTYLYDEDRWPSGAAGGLVTRDHAYRIRFLVFSPQELKSAVEDSAEKTSTGKAVRSAERRELGRYAVRLDNGKLAGYRMIRPGRDELQDGEKAWYAYLEISGDNPWYNNQAYLNTLDKKAVERFIEVTHEAYFREFGEFFGREMPSIFTDEPQCSMKGNLRTAQDETAVTLPWTDDLEETFHAAYNHSLIKHLPELIWELPDGKISVRRYEYHDHLAERFCEAFSDTVGSWCREHGIRMTGHVMCEQTLLSQTQALSEAMRFYRSMDIPGIDMLCDFRELSTAKQAQSAVHQYGREGMMSELYGVTNWDFDFRGHKLQGDWQAALGVTLRVPHLFWTSMEGEAKRDYPASIGFQSPWYRQYDAMETYFARINTCLTRGKAVERIGVIHPIESYWLYWGCEDQTGSIRSEMDRQFLDLFDILLYGLQDFDLIAESLLPEQAQGKTITRKSFPVGEMSYEVLVVPNCVTLRRTTIDLLEAFRDAGGRIIFAGKTPSLESARPSERVKRLVERCEQVPFTREALLAALEPCRFIEVRNQYGLRSDNLIYQHRTEGKTDWLFLAHVKKMPTPDLPNKEILTITLSGRFRVTEYRATDGKLYPVLCTYQGNRTILRAELYEHDSLLLKLEALRPETDAAGKRADSRPAESMENRLSEAVARSQAVRSRMQQTDVPGTDVQGPALSVAGAGAIPPDMTDEGIQLTAVPVPVTLEEPNVLLLDQAEYRFDEEPWQPREEILRIDNLFREKLGMPLRMEAFAQPWVTGDAASAEPMHTLALRMTIHSETAVENTVLALECADRCKVFLNGKPGSLLEGFYVDPAIQKVSLGTILAGDNLLEVTIPFNSAANPEAMYLLGDFGVRVQGAFAKLIPPVRELAFGDIAAQGLPFYGGNLTYHTSLKLEEERHVWLRISKFRAPLLAVSADGEKKGTLAFSPYMADLGILAPGEHRVDITMYGSRVNTFGAVHNCDEIQTWFGPNVWRTKGDYWSYEYQLWRVGVLKSPVIVLR